MSRQRFYKPALLLLAAGLLWTSSFVQRRLNEERSALGLTREIDRTGMPPVLAVTTVALGGFRGLIANALWIRAQEMQAQDKYFEMVQLADWITKLQPHVTTVWYHQAWNMSYNISVKFTSPKDRWFWVRRGIELLRDEGLRYNPEETLLYRELAWFYQDKMGKNLDDAHLYFKLVWAGEMHQLFGGEQPNFAELKNPQTDVARTRAQRLREIYKLNPEFMEQVDLEYGPFDWRLPEAHAVYWAVKGLKFGRKEEQVQLRRIVYQSMQLAFERGRMIDHKTGTLPDFGPNLDIIPNANKAYEKMMAEETIADPKGKGDKFKQGHHYFLKNVVMNLYTHNREKDAAHWFKVLKEKYPELLVGLPDSLDDFAVYFIMGEVKDGSVDKIKSIIEGYLTQWAISLAGSDDEEKATSLERLARMIWRRHELNVGAVADKDRINLPPYEKIKKEVVLRLLDPQRGLRPEMAAKLRTELNMSAPTNAPPAISPFIKAPSITTNSVPSVRPRK